MAGDPGNRRLMPQGSQMQSFSFAPNPSYYPAPGPRENQKNYVFVDEHNRHKRLKVMRACEGCRRRKIRCDAATSNTWPCSACVRLKLHCVPPTVNYDREFAPDSQAFESDHLVDYDSHGSPEDEYSQHAAAVQQQQHLAAQVHKDVSPIYSQHIPYADPVGVYAPLQYPEVTAGHAPPAAYYAEMPPSVVLDQQHQHNPYAQQTVFPSPPLQHQHNSSASPESYETDGFGQQDLVDLLGSLKMDPAGTAPYLSRKNKGKGVEDEEPAFEEVDEFKNALPTHLSGPDLKIRIPPALMPDDATVLNYFGLYFDNVHPYVPVVNKPHLYQQWHTNRESISPLLLEAIFAIAGRLADEPAQGHQWLALATKHLDSFLDVPRLSTLQAMLIILKARESVPKKGYYFRSWLTIVQCLEMAKDLGLDEHYDEHKAGRSCGADLADCITKTRIWQTVFICELMIGTPQGRSDLAVEMDSLDLGIPRLTPGSDESEYHVTRQFTYFTKVVRNVRRMNDVYARIKKNKEWGVDPDFVQLNPSFDAWMNDLPADLQITFPPDGTPPWLPTHFIGNMHSYFYLSILLLHRPQLEFMDPTGLDGGWKHHMLLCYSTAKLLCRLQEAILEQFGLTGLLNMQRGINFTIYCVLTCTVLHLVAITSPDPDLNHDAREYFTRHMRILEKCTSSWPMPDMQAQIDSLREAFSADLRKPFALKPSFPYGSPAGSVNMSPPLRNTQYRQSSLEHQHATPSQVSYTSHPISPPISISSSVDTKSDSSPAIQPLVMMPSGQVHAHVPVQGQQHPGLPQQQQSLIGAGVPMADPSTWNPSRIFNHWNTAFSAPPPPPQPHTPQIGSNTVPGAGISTSSPQQSMAQQQYQTPIATFAAPNLWQEAVASVYEGGLKRGWDFGDANGGGSMSKRAR